MGCVKNIHGYSVVVQNNPEEGRLDAYFLQQGQMLSRVGWDWDWWVGSFGTDITEELEELTCRWCPCKKEVGRTPPPKAPKRMQVSARTRHGGQLVGCPPFVLVKAQKPDTVKSSVCHPCSFLSGSHVVFLNKASEIIA